MSDAAYYGTIAELLVAWSALFAWSAVCVAAATVSVRTAQGGKTRGIETKAPSRHPVGPR